MIARVYEKNRDVLLAACDKELLGKKFEENGLIIDVKEEFYNGKEVNADSLSQLLDEVTIANLVGDKVVSVAKKKNLISEEGVLVVQGVPHAQIFRML